MKNFAFCCCLIALFASAMAYADSKSHDDVDDTLIVYGVRIDQAATEVGSSVTVITADDISAMGVNYLVDALTTAPGVTVNQNGTFGGTASVRIRGASSQQTLVIVDGVVVNDPGSPGGGFDFARLDPAHVDRIEVLRGPQSTLWGTDAMGGVINITTKRGVSDVGGDAFMQVGSFATRRGGATLHAGGERFDFRLSAVQNVTDGISKADETEGNTEKDPYESTSISAVAGIDIGDARLQTNILWSDADTNFDSFVFGAQGNVADGDETSTTRELAANVTLKLPLFNGKLENYLLFGHAEIERRSFASGIATFGSDGDRVNFRYQGTVSIDDNKRIAFGAEREDTESASEDTSIDGLFALYEFSPIAELTLTAGLRRDNHKIYGTETTARLAVAYNPREQLTLRASWGEGFKAPTLFQTTFFCCGAASPSADLRPETSEAYDLGFTVRSKDSRAEVGLTYFDQDTTDLIDFSFGIGGYENIAAARSTGVELDGRYWFNDFVEASISLSYINAKDGDGVRLIRAPRQSGNLLVRVNSEGRLSGSVVVRFNGKEQDLSGELAAWTRVDLSSRFALSDNVEIYARIENLLDEQYQQIVGYGTPGRSAYVGARLSF